MIAEAIDASGPRAAGYLAVAVVALVAVGRERREVGAGADRWPRFWLLTAALLAAMGVSRLMEWADWIADTGEDAVRRRGWYDQRQFAQVLFVTAVAGVWALATSFALWRIPRRRYRYLPAAAVVAGLVAYALIRTVSFHPVDALLYRRDFAGVRFVAWFEWIGLGLAALSTMWFPFMPWLDRSTAGTSPPPSVDGRAGR